MKKIQKNELRQEKDDVTASTGSLDFYRIPLPGVFPFITKYSRVCPKK